MMRKMLKFHFFVKSIFSVAFSGAQPQINIFYYVLLNSQSSGFLKLLKLLF